MWKSSTEVLFWHKESLTTMEKQEQITAVKAAALSIKGQERSHNEDAVYDYTAVADNGGYVGLYRVLPGI